MADSTEQKPAVDEAAPVAVETPVEQQDTPLTEPEEDVKSKRVTLADLTARGTALYARKEYEEAAGLFSKAAEMQAELNGDDIHPDNADILFLYGRSLFKVGQSKSDVLGGKAPAEKKPEKTQLKAPKQQPPASTADAEAEEAKSEAEKVTQAGITALAEDSSAEPKAEKPDNKPMFHFEGDENLEGSDEEEGDEEEEAEEEEDDLGAAFDMLELARVSLQKRLAQLEQENGEADEGKGKEVSEGDNPTVRHVKERLADTHDLLAEISLENEKFPAAIQDSRVSLKFKKELYPPESELIAEAHFKLSLALEFASITTTKEEGDDEQADVAPFDEKLREEAISELEAAIASTKLKLQAKEVELAEGLNPEENVAVKAQITDVRDIISDMEDRLKEMRKPPVDLKATLENAAGGALQGIIGSALGETPAQTEARVEEAKKTATDLTGLVKKKKKAEPEVSDAQANGHESNGTKRKAEDVAEEESTKKVKVTEEEAA